MLRSTTALLNYTRSAQIAEGIPGDGTCEEVQEALAADFEWITDLELQFEGSALAVIGSPCTEAETADFRAFIEDLFDRDPAAVGKLLLEDEPMDLVVPLWLDTSV